MYVYIIIVEWTRSATTFPLVYQSEGQTTSPYADNFNGITFY